MSGGATTLQNKSAPHSSGLTQNDNIKPLDDMIIDVMASIFCDCQ